MKKYLDRDLLPPLYAPALVSSRKEEGTWMQQMSMWLLLRLLHVLDCGTKKPWRRGGGWSSRALTRTRPSFQVTSLAPSLAAHFFDEDFVTWLKKWRLLRASIAVGVAASTAITVDTPRGGLQLQLWEEDGEL
jgi:hypothetical protein